MNSLKQIAFASAVAVISQACGLADDLLVDKEGVGFENQAETGTIVGRYGTTMTDDYSDILREFDGAVLEVEPSEIKEKLSFYAQEFKKILKEINIHDVSLTVPDVYLYINGENTKRMEALSRKFTNPDAIFICCSLPKDVQTKLIYKFNEFRDWLHKDINVVWPNITETISVWNPGRRTYIRRLVPKRKTVDLFLYEINSKIHFFLYNHVQWKAMNEVINRTKTISVTRNVNPNSSVETFTRLGHVLADDKNNDIQYGALINRNFPGSMVPALLKPVTFGCDKTKYITCFFEAETNGDKADWLVRDFSYVFKVEAKYIMKNKNTGKNENVNPPIQNIIELSLDVAEMDSCSNSRNAIPPDKGGIKAAAKTTPQDKGFANPLYITKQITKDKSFFDLWGYAKVIVDPDSQIPNVEDNQGPCLSIIKK